MVRVDLHLHTMWSGDATTTPDELAAAVAESGIDVLCITDHGAVAGAQRFAATGELGCRVVVGQELKCAQGELIGLFLSERIPFGLTPADGAQAVREQGGLVYVPHPFDEVRHCLPEPVLHELADAGLLDAIEVFNAKVSLASLNEKAREFAVRRALPGGAGSDAHEPSAIGAAYVEMPDFTDATTFLSSLRLGRIVGHAYDAPRTWRPRIVPSTKTT
ncbi:MAG TPA: PHP domain-containing protein [Acidimicrobiales bacterium]|nr:PHP domain-containing protein [Acidimicrobiales bacterium]